MKSLKVAKYEFFETLNSIKVYYGIVISIIAVLTILSDVAGGEIRSSGLDFSTVIFIFVAGLNSFKSSFKFTQGNNITRKTFFQGLIISSLPIGALMAVIDVILNRIYNIFVFSPTLHDMIYEKAFGTDLWVQSNSLSTLFGTIIFLTFLYIMIFNLGIFINLLYYRSNVVLKVVISIAPFALLSLLGNVINQFPREFWRGIGRFFSKAFGIETYNSYMAAFSFLVIAIILLGFIYLLVRRAVVKE